MPVQKCVGRLALELGPRAITATGGACKATPPLSLEKRCRAENLRKPKVFELTPQMKQDERLLKKKEFAERSQVSERTVERWVAENRVPYIRLPKRGSRTEVRFLWSQVLKYLEKQTSKPVPLQRHMLPKALRKEANEG